VLAHPMQEKWGERLLPSFAALAERRQSGASVRVYCLALISKMG
jgi:hypothetical protein